MHPRAYAYVRRILVNAHTDEVRRLGRRRERHVPELPEALETVPPGMRAAVVLRHWLDLSVEETAELLNCSAGTVKSQTAKAAARLRVRARHRSPQGAVQDRPGRVGGNAAAGLPGQRDAQGLVVQGSTPYALVIASSDDRNKDPDFFLGKLVVML